MTDPRDLYVVDEDVAAELAAGGHRPPLLHTVRGFVDAGGAAQVVAGHLADRFGTRRLATFDVDRLLDYRSRRPAMTFDVWRWTSYDRPELVVDVVHDAEGAPFLLLHGSEPDLMWERFVTAVRDLVERFDVPVTVGVNGIPMGVPHTRPIGVTTHGTRRDLVGPQGWFGRVEVPAGVGALLEHRLGQWGHDAVGVAVHVPHYLAQSTYPQAGLVALRHVEQVTGLALDVDALEPAAHRANAEVERQVADAEEVGVVVRALEKQYDEVTDAAGRRNLLDQTAELPTADEIGAEFERFLAQHGDDEA